MPRQTYFYTEKRHHIMDGLYRFLTFRRHNPVRISNTRSLCLLGIFATACMLGTGVRAEAKMPVGVKGWFYAITLFPFKNGYATTAEEGCALNAAHHWGTRLLFMAPKEHSKPRFSCFYKNPVGGKIDAYTDTHLVCETGYTAKAPGLCVPSAEPSRPASCNPADPGYSLANPVAVASGAKIQTETDFPGVPNGALRITRTYRTLRDHGTGQSAGHAWSFSFDRAFATVFMLNSRKGDPPAFVNGAFGDGTSFEFSRSTSGTFISRYNQRERLQSVNATFDDWILTRADGAVEQFKKFNGRFLLVGSYTKEGVGQAYTYTEDNKLATITDASGRILKVTWAGDAVASITGATGSVRYRYELSNSAEGVPIPGTERLTSVEFFDAGERFLTTRSYHYEDGNNRYLLTGTTDENGVRFATYAYNESGQAILSEHAGGVNRFTFAYPEITKRIVTDPLGTERQIDLTYSRATGRVAGISQPAGAGCGPGYSKLNYDAAGRATSSTDFNDNKTCFITDEVRGLVTSRVLGLTAAEVCPASATAAIAAASRRISTEWHPDVALETAVAGPKQITRYVYNGQRTSDGSLASCAANATLPNGKPIVVLCSKTIQATGDANGAKGFAALPDGRPRTWHYNYNASGQLLKKTGPSGADGQVASITYTYYHDTTEAYTKGDLARSENGVGESIQYLEYTQDGLPTKLKRANETSFNLAYGPKQRLTASTIENGKGRSETTQYSYDGVGQLTRKVSPDGMVRTYSYDDAHRLTSLGDGAGNRVLLTLDHHGNVTKQEIRDAAGNLLRESSRAYDALNRLASVKRAPMEPAFTYQYDRGGNLTSITDPLGRVTAATFDSLDRIVNETLAPAAPGKPTTTITYGVDHQDKLVSITDPRTLITRYSVDGYGQQQAINSPDTGTEFFSFDDAGNLVSSRDARGVTTNYSYDAARRATKFGTTTVEYGKFGSSAAGQLTLMTDESGQTTYTYDGFARLQSTAQTIGSGTAAKRFELFYEYGESGGGVGHVTSMTYPSGNRIAIAYGADGKPTDLTLFPPKTANSTMLLSNIQYAPFGLVKSWVWGNGTETPRNEYMREFDVAGRIKRYSLGPIGASGNLRTLNYDDVGRIMATTHTGTPDASILDQKYAYDDLDRLIGVEGVNLSQAFEYDSNGNRTKATFGSGTYTNILDSASNRLLRTTGPVPPKNNSYDAAGNLTNDGTTKFTYGIENRLAASDVSGITTRYRYNGLGQRVAKLGGAGILTHYVYDTRGRLVGEYDQAGKAIQETIYLEDLPVIVLRPGSEAATNPAVASDIYYVYADHIRTPRVIMQARDNRIVWRWDNADPFGLQQPDESPSGLPKFTYNLRFPGQLYDKETNTNYNYFRDYDPQTGRYMQSDPVGLAGGLNTYSYVGGNPVNLVDPFGLTQCDVDFAFQFAVMKNLDLNFGEGPPIVDLPWNGDLAGSAGIRRQGLRYVPDRSGRIHLRMSYLDSLSTADKIRLLRTIIHEALHFSGPALLQGDDYDFDHAFINPETARRVAALKMQYIKELKNCGC